MRILEVFAVYVMDVVLAGVGWVKWFYSRCRFYIKTNILNQVMYKINPKQSVRMYMQASLLSLQKEKDEFATLDLLFSLPPHLSDVLTNFMMYIQGAKEIMQSCGTWPFENEDEEFSSTKLKLIYSKLAKFFLENKCRGFLEYDEALDYQDALLCEQLRQLIGAMSAIGNPSARFDPWFYFAMWSEELDLVEIAFCRSLGNYLIARANKQRANIKDYVPPGLPPEFVVKLIEMVAEINLIELSLSEADRFYDDIGVDHKTSDFNTVCLFLGGYLCHLCVGESFPILDCEIGLLYRGQITKYLAHVMYSLVTTVPGDEPDLLFFSPMDWKDQTFEFESEWDGE